MSDKKRVLIIEDDHYTRLVLAKLLRLENYEVKDYVCCESAATHLYADDIDIALLDVGLPGRPGHDYGRELRQLSTRVMIVFVTGEATMELRLGVQDCFVMQKPVDARQLLGLMQRFDLSTGYPPPMGDPADYPPAIDAA